MSEVIAKAARLHAVFPLLFFICSFFLFFSVKFLDTPLPPPPPIVFGTPSLYGRAFAAARLGMTTRQPVRYLGFQQTTTLVSNQRSYHLVSMGISEQLIPDQDYNKLWLVKTLYTHVDDVLAWMAWICI